MKIDAYLENAVVYDVFYKLDIKVGQKFTLVMDKPEEMDDVFVNRDSVLAHDHKGTDITLDALMVGTSKVRIFKDVTIVREILVNVVDSIVRPATSLNVSFEEAQPK